MWGITVLRSILHQKTDYFDFERIPCKVDNRKNIEIKELNVNINADVLPPSPLASSSIVNQNIQPSKMFQYCLKTLLVWGEITHVHGENKNVFRLCPSFNTFLFCPLQKVFSSGWDYNFCITFCTLNGQSSSNTFCKSLKLIAIAIHSSLYYLSWPQWSKPPSLWAPPWHSFHTFHTEGSSGRHQRRYWQWSHRWQQTLDQHQSTKSSLRDTFHLMFWRFFSIFRLLTYYLLSCLPCLPCLATNFSI